MLGRRGRRRGRRAPSSGVGAAVLALTLALTGCTAEAAAPTPSPTATPSATPYFSSDDAALAAAKAAYGRYIDALNDTFNGGGSSLESLKAAARGTALKGQIASAREYEEKGYHSVGSASFDSFRLQDVENRTSAFRLTAYTCLDISAVSVVNASGESVVRQDRANRFPRVITFIPRSKDELVVSDDQPWSGEGFC